GHSTEPLTSPVGVPADAVDTRLIAAGVPSMSPRGSSERGRRWVLPTVIAVAAALILAGIGVVIGLLAPWPARPQPTPLPRAVQPPLITGPDLSSLHQSCDQGFSLPTATGFGTHAGRGTPETSCLFADSVLTSYWAEYGNASPLPRAVSAPGAVDC